MPTEAKIAEVAAIKDRMERSTAVVLADFRGMTVAQANSFRADLRKEGLEFRVVKNRLLGRAAAEAGVEGMTPYLEGPTAVLFGYADPVAPAKAAAAFAKANREQMTIKVGLLDGRLLTAAEVTALSELPSREVLLAKVVTGMASPMTQMASALSAAIRNLGYGLGALLEKRQAEA